MLVRALWVTVTTNSNGAGDGCSSKGLSEKE